MIDKIEETTERLTILYADLSGRESANRAEFRTQARKLLKSLLKECAMEIINTKIKSFGFDKASQEMGAEILRAEQREKLLTEDKESV